MKNLTPKRAPCVNCGKMTWGLATIATFPRFGIKNTRKIMYLLKIEISKFTYRKKTRNEKPVCDECFIKTVKEIVAKW